jgi:hypothetical protein
MSNYNQKLFSGGIRSYLHHLRFHWLQKHLIPEEPSYTLFELGCFDCRSLHFIAKPKHYLGVDAGWEGGLEDARLAYRQDPSVELVIAQSVHDLKNYDGRRFDYSIALETLEHMNDSVLRGYVEFLARVTKKRLLITVPVEIGPVFLAKYIAKSMVPKLKNGETESYTLREVIAATRGRVDQVQRYEHKGFDYRLLIKLLSDYFIITKVEGIPFTNAPSLSFQVGIIAEPQIAL